MMAGGTSRKNHSEVGSSFIHFNYTPHQDKATASLLGDVPRGVLLDQAPIFLGGQGGLVGPVQLTYGTITAAGTICRHDVTETGQLVYGALARKEGHIPYQPQRRGSIDRIVKHNLAYIGNLHALRDWYLHVRARSLDPVLHAGALARLSAMIEERVLRLDQVADEPGSQSSHASHRSFAGAWPKHRQEALSGPDLSASDARDRCLERLAMEGPYLDAIAALDNDTKPLVVSWLQSIVDSVATLC
jgi:UDP-N-acetylglucosamine/UDP-N-acetylgalactosamine diphosphorylase